MQKKYYVNKHYDKYSWFVVSTIKNKDYNIEVSVEPYGLIFYSEDQNKLIEVTEGYAPVLRQDPSWLELGRP